MKLSAYLEKHNLSDDKFAELIGKSRPTVSRLRRQEKTGQLPSRETIEAIARATNGEVTANDFWLADAAA